MKLRALEVRRLPGIDSPFELTPDDLSTGANLIEGPNASGKTSLCRAVRALLWPSTATDVEISLRAVWDIEGEEIAVEREGSRVVWSRDGTTCDPPPLPSARFAACFTITLDDLMDGEGGVFANQDGELAAEIARQVAGGCDLRPVRVIGRVGRHHAQAEARALRTANERIASIRGQHAALRDKEEQLEGLHERLAAAREAGGELVQVALAAEYQRARIAAEKAAATLAEFPEGMSLLSGKEGERLQELSTELEEERARELELEEEAKRARERRDEAGLDEDGLEQRDLVLVGETLSQLRELEHELARLRADLRRLEARVASAARALDPASDVRSRPALDAGSAARVQELLHRAHEVGSHRNESTETSSEVGPQVRIALSVLVLLVAGASGVLAWVHHPGWIALLLPALVAGAHGARPRTLTFGGTRRATELAEAERSLDEDRQALRRELGVDVTSELGLATVFTNLRSYQGAETEREEQETLIASAEARYDELLDRANERLVAYGEPPGSDAPLVTSALESLKVRNASLRSAQAALRATDGERHRCRVRIDRKEAQIESLHVAAGIPPDDMDALGRRLSRLADWRRAEDVARKAKGEQARLGDELRSRPELTVLSGEELTERHVQLQERASERDLHLRSIAEIDRDLAHAKAESVLEAALAARDSDRDDLGAKRNEALLAAATRYLLDRVDREHRISSRPKVLRRAADLFGRFTHHRYELQLARSSEEEAPIFRAVDTRVDRSLSLSELSSGTRIQLLLSARLAYAAELEVAGGGALPIFLDEALSTSDPDRYRAAVESLEVLVHEEDRQVFYLTSQPSDAAFWADPDLRQIDLAAVRRQGRAVTDERELTLPPRPEVPAPNGTAEEYAHELGVPRFDPRLEIGEAHLFYLLRDDLELLHALLSSHIESYGQLRSLIESGAIETYVPDFDADRVESWATITAAVLEAWRVGRGRPIDRAVLLRGGVSERFIDNLSDLAREKGGDAADWLLALEERSDERTKGFQSRTSKRLRGFLQEEGFFDPRDILSESEVYGRVLSLAEPIVKRSGLTASELRGRFEWLWHLCSGEGSQPKSARALSRSGG